MNASVKKKFFTIAETCQRLGAKKTFVYALVTQGRLTKVNLPSPKKVRPGVEQSPGPSRITAESIDRYEASIGQPAPRVEAKPAAEPPKQRLVRTRTSHQALAASHFA